MVNLCGYRSTGITVHSQSLSLFRILCKGLHLKKISCIASLYPCKLHAWHEITFNKTSPGFDPSSPSLLMLLWENPCPL